MLILNPDVITKKPKCPLFKTSVPGNVNPAFVLVSNQTQFKDHNHPCCV